MLNIPNSSLPRIVIIGCGFGGLKFSKFINTSRYQVVLIDKNNYHTFQPLLYQVASSGLEPDSVVYPIRKIFKNKKKFHVRITEVIEINHEDNIVTTNIGKLTYDYLILGIGGITNYFNMGNVKKYSMPMKSLIESLNLRSLVIQNFEDALATNDLAEREQLMNFVIVGGGATGVELAGALSELKEHVLPFDYPDLDIRLMKINILESGDKLLPNMSLKSSLQAYKYLNKMGVNVWLNCLVKDYLNKSAITEKGVFHTNCLIWAAGIRVKLIKGLEMFKVKSNGRLLVDSCNKLKGSKNIYVIGDSAFQLNQGYEFGLPMMASVAEQQGKHLAKNFNKFSDNNSFTAFKYFDKGVMATVGRNKAVVEVGKLKYSGLIGWLTWMFVHLMLLVDFRNRLIVMINWVWSYFKYEKGTRLIINKLNDSDKSKPCT